METTISVNAAAKNTKPNTTRKSRGVTGCMSLGCCADIPKSLPAQTEPHPSVGEHPYQCAGRACSHRERAAQHKNSNLTQHQGLHARERQNSEHDSGRPGKKLDQ